jgi:YVTN family beta-propeller protein
VLPSEVVVTANRDDRSLTLVDPDTARALGSIALQRPPHQVALSSDGRFAFATDPSEGSRAVVVAELSSGRQVGEITVGARPDGIATPAGGGPVVVSNSGDDTVTTFDQSTRTPSAPTSVGHTPRGLTVAGVDGAVRALIANEADGTLTILDVAGRQLVSTVPVGGRPIAVAAAVDGSHAYVLDAEGGNVVTVDLRANRSTGSLRVGDRLTSLDTTADGRFLLITADDPTNNLYRVDLGLNQLVSTTNVGAGALAIAASPRAARVYVTTADNRLVIWDIAADRAVATIPVGRRPEGIAVRVTVAPNPSASPSPASTTGVRPAPSPAVTGSPSPVPKP